MTTKKVIDPYRYFFPAGFLLGIIGVLYWLLFPAGLVAYPGLKHPDVMMAGFFLFFVCGFLMTTIPQFFLAHKATFHEQITAIVLIASYFFTLLSPDRYLGFLVNVFLFLFIIIYAFKRFRVRKVTPPDSFVFVGIGLATGLIGAVLLLINEFTLLSYSLGRLGRLFLLQAYIVSLVMGVGARMVPALLGNKFVANNSKLGPIKSNVPFLGSLGVIFIFSYVVELYFSFLWGNILRSIVMTFLVCFYWKIYRIPKKKSVLTFSIWSAGWLMLFSQWSIVALPNMKIHLLHILLISSLSLLTFMIASRIILSHWKYGTNVEKRSLFILGASGLIILAGLTRFSAGIRSDLYDSHLIYASITWIAALLVWGIYFIPKIIKIKE